MPQSIVIQGIIAYELTSQINSFLFYKVGQCGNQIGGRFWDKVLQENQHYNQKSLFNDPMSTFFRNVDKRLRGGVRAYGSIAIAYDSVQVKESIISQ